MTSKVLGSWPPEHGAVQAVAPHVEHLLAPNPSSWTYEGTNSYVIAHGGASVLIDPAVTDATHLDALRRRGQHDGRQVSAILLTHDHPDHSDGAREVAGVLGVPVLCLSPRFADELPADGAVLDAHGTVLRVDSYGKIIDSPNRAIVELDAGIADRVGGVDLATALRRSERAHV